MRKNPDLREMLLKAGVGNYNAAMGIQFMNMLPNTTDPYAAGTIQLVQGLQRLLNKQGARLAVDGGMGASTVRAVRKFSGPLWSDKSWSQIYSDVIAGSPWEEWARESRAKTQTGLEGLGATPDGRVPLPIFMPGTIAGATLQIAINRMGQQYDIGGNVQLDGKVGTQTVTALNRIAGSIGLDGNLSASTALTMRSVAQAVSAANTLASQLNYLADLAKLPALPIVPVGPYKLGDRSAPPPPPPGTPGVPSSGVLSALKSPMGIAAIAIGSLLVLRSAKKGRRR